MMTVLTTLLLLVMPGGKEVRYFPSILYGHILIGSGMSRYDTTFTATARHNTRAALALFTDQGEPMEASFLDERGNVARTGSRFEFLLSSERPLRIKIQLTPDDAKETVVVKTGWATFSSSEAIDVTATVLITTPDGKIISRHILSSETPTTGL
ncbi:MAG: hypothetical protein HY646_04455 [Acidobacteria bacterium]|nr:hypothetical protein [Acidobacteriota bacterium]